MSLPVTSLPVAPHCSPANDNLSVPITTEAAFTIVLLRVLLYKFYYRTALLLPCMIQYQPLSKENVLTRFNKYGCEKISQCRNENV